MTNFVILDLTLRQAIQAVGSQTTLDQVISLNQALTGHELKTGAKMHFSWPQGELKILLRGTISEIRASQQALANGENLIKK